MPKTLNFMTAAAFALGTSVSVLAFAPQAFAQITTSQPDMTTHTPGVNNGKSYVAPNGGNGSSNSGGSSNGGAGAAGAGAAGAGAAGGATGGAGGAAGGAAGGGAAGSGGTGGGAGR
jgi:hypothetical protein